MEQYYITMKALIAEGISSSKGYYLTDEEYLADNLKDAKKFETVAEANKFLMLWKYSHSDMVASFSFSINVYKEMKPKQPKEKKIVEATVPVEVTPKPVEPTYPTTTYINNYSCGKGCCNRRPRGLWGFLLTFLLCLTCGIGATFHHWVKPMISNIQDGEQGIQGEQGTQGIQGLQGEQGVPGINGLTPYIGENGHWWIGNTDTGYIAGANSSITPDNPYYGYINNGCCDEGGTETYIDETGNRITYAYQAGEHLFNDDTHTCLRDDAQTVIKGSTYDMAICGTTACVWAKDGGTTVGTNNGGSFKTIFDALGETVKTLIIKDGIKKILANSFRDCTDLTTVIFNNDLEYIGAYAFDNTNVTEFTLPGTIKSLGFNGRDALNPYKVESITILENTINPDDYAELDLVAYYYDDPDTGEEVELDWNYYAENSTKYANLTYFESYANVKLDLMCFRNCISLEEVVLHKESIIDGWVFQGCTSLEYVDLGQVTEIGVVAFQCCESLKEIYLPSSLITMDKWVFDGCGYLQHIYIEEETKPEGWHNEWPGTINFIYTPKTPTAANNVRYHNGNKTTINWGVTEENLEGISTEEYH